MKIFLKRGFGIVLVLALVLGFGSVFPVAAVPPNPTGANWDLYIPDYVYPSAVPAPGMKYLPVPVTGTRPLLVILLAASGETPQAGNDVAHYTTLVAGARPSLNDYWTEVSYGIFNGYTPCTVVDWHTSTYTRAEIASDPPASPNVRDAVREAITFANDHVNYATYDTNGDGTVTNDELTIAVITTGVGGDSGGTAVWSHHWQAGSVAGMDGKTIEGEYFITCEGNPMGTWAHELGHDLELPDLYDTTPLNPDSEGIGNFGLMGAGSWLGPTHLVAYHKWRLGWLTPTTISSPQCLDITDVETHPVAYILSTSVATEYFMVENRWRGTSYDSIARDAFHPFLPDQGILITHIDENTYNTKWAGNDVNGDEAHKAVDVECPDHVTSHWGNDDDLDDLTNRGDATDLWDNTAYDFTDLAATCKAILYNGANSGVQVGSFPAPAATMHVCFNGATPNLPPVAEANGPYSGNVGQTITFSSAGSNDPDGTITAYDWDWGDGTAHGSGASPTHAYSTAGTKTVTLMITDDDGAPGMDTATVNVNTLPVAEANGPYGPANIGQTITFSSAGSNDPDGTITAYDWDWGDGTAHGSGASPTHAYTTSGTKTVTLTVTDNSGGTGSDTTTVTIRAPPVAVPGGPYSALIGETVAFNGAGSYDPDGTIVAYDWNYGDGTAHGTVQNPTHRYTTTSTRTYTVTLRVTDNDALTGTATTTVRYMTSCDGINDLKAQVQAMPLSATIKNALVTKLNKARQLCVQGKKISCADTLKKDFIVYVNSKRGAGITNAQADQMVAYAQRIITALG